MEDHAYILDYLPSGRPDDPGRREPIAYAVGDDEFVLFELVPKAGVNLLVGDRVYIGKKTEEREKIERVRGRIQFDEMTHNAQNELSYVLEELVKGDPERFLHIYNEGGAISTRMHVLELLPGLGKKLMKAILQERKKGRFESFEDLDERIPALHQPAKLVAKRIEVELQDEHEKYHLYARSMRNDDDRGGGHRH